MSHGLADLPAVELPSRAASSGTLPAFLAGAALEHGPIFRATVPIGREAGREIVFMVGPEANRFVLHTHRDHFSHHEGWTPVLGASVGQGLLNMDDPAHAHHRRLWSPAFTTAATQRYLPRIERVIVERIGSWRERGEVDLYEEARRITFDIAATVLAGLPPGATLDRVRELFYVMFHSFDRRRESTQAFQRRKAEARRELDATILPLIAAQRRLGPDARRDVLGLLAHALDEQGRPLADEQVLAHLNILLVAGHETTTTLGTWALYLLATLPEQRARIRAELAEAPAGLHSLDAIQALPALDCFVREVGRLFSPVINLPRGVLKPFQFAGYTIPAGTSLRLALAAGHRLPHLFAAPDTFDPNRFAPPRDEDKRRPYALITFGGGQRVCIGVNVAQIEIKALIAHVLQAYDLDILPGQRPIHAGFWVARIPFGIRATVREQPPTRH